MENAVISWAQMADEIDEYYSTEEGREAEYRRGYCDGWISAVEEMFALMCAGFSRYEAYSACWDHWDTELAEWQKTDLDHVVLPPPLRPRRR
jgi:hypothetical protein